MAKRIITPLLLLLFVTGFSQGINFEVRGAYTRAIKKEKLYAAQTMGDIISDYPASWISAYISTAIILDNNGKTMQAAGTNDTLNTAQKALIQMADLGTEIIIDIAYRYKNSVTGAMDFREMHYSASIIPEIEAEYPGGLEQMRQYLKENAIQKLDVSTSKQFEPVKIRFTVNESGKISNARITTPSGDEKTNKLLLGAITRMPKWKPAENATGMKVKQEFEFSVGNIGC